MKVDKIRAMDTAEIGTQLVDGREQAFRLRFQLNMGQTDGVKRLRELRKDRARMLTILREREEKPRQVQSEASKAQAEAQAQAAAEAAQGKKAARTSGKKAGAKAAKAAKKAAKPAAKKAAVKKPAAKKSAAKKTAAPRAAKGTKKGK